MFTLPHILLSPLSFISNFCLLLRPPKKRAKNESFKKRQKAASSSEESDAESGDDGPMDTGLSLVDDEALALQLLQS